MSILLVSTTTTTIYTTNSPSLQPFPWIDDPDPTQRREWPWPLPEGRTSSRFNNLQYFTQQIFFITWQLTVRSRKELADKGQRHKHGYEKISNDQAVIIITELGTRYYFPGWLIVKSLICFHASLSLKRYFFEFPGLLTAKSLLNKKTRADLNFWAIDPKFLCFKQLYGLQSLKNW